MQDSALGRYVPGFHASVDPPGYAGRLTEAPAHTPDGREIGRGFSPIDAVDEYLTRHLSGDRWYRLVRSWPPKASDVTGAGHQQPGMRDWIWCEGPCSSVLASPN